LIFKLTQNELTYGLQQNLFVNELEFNILKWGGFVSTKNQKINERRLSLDILGL
jgi:hypothetical protein